MVIGKTKIGRLTLYLVLIIATTNYVPAQASTEAQGSASEAPSQLVKHHLRASLEDRVRTLSQALNLDETQQSAMKKVLEGQREQVAKVWSDSSIPPAYRISTTRAISDRTSDQIRALLNDEQRNKYNTARQTHEVSTETNKRSVEEWIEATKPKDAAVSPNQ